MQWHSWTEFWHMGGYGLYVWGSFGVTALVVLLEILQLRVQRRSLLCNLSHEIVSQEDPYQSISS